MMVMLGRKYEIEATAVDEIMKERETERERERDRDRERERERENWGLI